MEHKVIILSLITFLITGCHTVIENQYREIPPTTQTGYMCVQQCKAMEKLCLLHNSYQKPRYTTRTQYLQCQHNLKLEARNQWRSYVFDKELNSLPNDKTINDFFDISMCHQSYNCVNDYHQCYIHCGGSILTTPVQVIPFHFH
jgi:hypothetical protein